MFVIIGWVMVTSAVLGGFLMVGGHLAALVQPAELVIIFGAAIGALIASNTPKSVKAVVGGIPQSLKGGGYTKELFMELLSLLYEILAKVRKEGLMAIEGDVEEPEKSAIFSKYPKVLKDHHLIDFMTDYLRIMVGGNLNAFEIEGLMDSEIDTHHQEADIPISGLAKLADGLPAFGIVAAVMGVVHTMESVNQPPAILGGLIAAALVGTFLGILFSYGFIGPLSANLEKQLAESTRAYACVKTTLLASLNGYPPVVAVEFGRKVLFSPDRPSFKELEDHIKALKGK